MAVGYALNDLTAFLAHFVNPSLMGLLYLLKPLVCWFFGKWCVPLARSPAQTPTPRFNAYKNTTKPAQSSSPRREYFRRASNSGWVISPQSAPTLGLVIARPPFIHRLAITMAVSRKCIFITLCLSTNTRALHNPSTGCVLTLNSTCEYGRPEYIFNRLSKTLVAWCIRSKRNFSITHISIIFIKVFL